jgi:hypothetical protein
MSAELRVSPATISIKDVPLIDQTEKSSHSGRTFEKVNEGSCSFPWKTVAAIALIILGAVLLATGIGALAGLPLATMAFTMLGLTGAALIGAAAGTAVAGAACIVGAAILLSQKPVASHKVKEEANPENTKATSEEQVSEKFIFTQDEMVMSQNLADPRIPFNEFSAWDVSKIKTLALNKPDDTNPTDWTLGWFRNMAKKLPNLQNVYLYKWEIDAEGRKEISENVRKGITIHVNGDKIICTEEPKQKEPEAVAPSKQVRFSQIKRRGEDGQESEEAIGELSSPRSGRSSSCSSRGSESSEFSSPSDSKRSSSVKN